MRCPHANPMCRIHDPIGIRLLTRLRLCLSYVNEHKSRDSFADCVNSLCSCSIQPEAKLHFFLHCRNLVKIRRKLTDKIKLVDETFL